ncbi:MAG: LacI family DNA-binding transcriptional regulator [Planctomycetota bacterium]|nr:LacI family DNA-binding transcriptional regulator [Planctomycetota bacterium]
MSERKVTLKDIGQQAGVSVGTVSRVLNGNPKGLPVAEKTAAAVLAAAERLGYRVDLGARAMRTGRYENVVLLTDPSRYRTDLSQPLLDAIHDRLAERSYSLIYARLAQGEVPKVLRQSMSDGLIVNYHDVLSPVLMEALAASGLPCVWLNRAAAHDAVLPDDPGAAAGLVAHFRALGCQRIVYIDGSLGGPQPVLPYRQARLDGYRTAMAAAAGTAEVYSNFDLVASDATIDACIVAEPSVPALVALSAAVQRRQAPIPRLGGIGARGIGDLPMATMDHPWPDMARAACDLLFEKILHGATNTASRLLPYSLSTPWSL